MLRALLELEADFPLGIDDERHVVELDDLHALESGVGCRTGHDRGDEVPRCDFVEEGVIVFQLKN